MSCSAAPGNEGRLEPLSLAAGPVPTVPTAASCAVPSDGTTRWLHHDPMSAMIRVFRRHCETTSHSHRLEIQRAPEYCTSRPRGLAARDGSTRCLLADPGGAGSRWLLGLARGGRDQCMRFPAVLRSNSAIGRPGTAPGARHVNGRCPHSARPVWHAAAHRPSRHGGLDLGQGGRQSALISTICIRAASRAVRQCASWSGARPLPAAAAVLGAQR
jgi:hypothetical protein